MEKRSQAAKSPASFFIRNKWSLVLWVVVFTFTLAGVLIALPQTRSAQAASASITVSPAGSPYSNRDDQPPIVVSGKGYTPNEMVNIYWNYTGPGTGKLEGSAVANKNGIFSFQFLRELAAYGAYTIAATGQTSNQTATTTYKQFPQLYVRAQAGGPNTPVTIYGNAYGAGETVNIYWNYTGPHTGSLWATAAGNATGSFAVNATIPNGFAPGTYPLEGIGHTTKAKSKYSFIIYIPTLALAPLNGGPGTSLTVSAYGFTGLENVSIYWDSNSSPVTTVATNGYGYLAPTVITVPSNAAPGNYTVKVVGLSSGLIIKNTFTVVAPSSTLGNSSGPVGDKVQVTGQGYAPNETVHIVWDYNGANTTAANLTAGLSGTFRGKFTVPQVSNGSYAVAAVGASSGAVTQNTFVLGNSVAANPSTNSPGQSTTINGTGFQPNESVQLFWDLTSGSPQNTTSADANGNISQPLNIPNSLTPGQHSVIAVGQTSGHSFNTPFTVNTSWGDFGFDPAHHRENTSEYGVGVSNVANLQLKWKGTTLVSLKDLPVYANGQVYIVTMDGYLNAYDATTGHLNWQFNSNSTFRNFSSPLVDSLTGLVFFGTVGYADEGVPSAFFAVDGSTGVLQWSVILNWHTVAFPTLAFNTIYVGTSHLDHTGSSVYALDEMTGNVLWQHSDNSGFWGAVGVDTSTNTVFTGEGNPGSAVLAMNALTGQVIWNTPIPQFGADDDVGSSITVDNGRIYASSKNGSVYALNESDGSLIWSTPIGSQSNGDISSQAVSANGILYVGQINGYMYALNASTGAVVWHIHTGSNIFSSPAVANGVVYYASFDKHIYAVNASTGAVLWSYATNNISYSSPIFVNGWLYCGSTDGNLYAFSL